MRNYQNNKHLLKYLGMQFFLRQNSAAMNCETIH